MFKYLVIGLSVCIAAAIILMKSLQLNASPHNETITVGLQSGYPPYEFMDENGKLVGFDIDVAERIAQMLGKTLVIKDMDFDGEILALKQRKIDLIISGMNITSSREKEILMVPYHGAQSPTLSLVFWNDIPGAIHSLDDIAKLPAATINVEAGTTPEEFMKKHYQSVKLKTFAGSLAPVLDVKFGKAIASLVGTEVAEYMKKKHPEIKTLIVPVADQESLAGCGIGINRKNHKLYLEVEQIIKELKASGELKKLENKWFKNE